MLKLDDIVALAKQGYKPSDVKELIELSKDSSEPEPTPTPDPEPTGEDAGKDPKGIEEKKEEPTPDDTKIVDYKEKLSELEAKLKASEEKLSKLQEENTKKKIADNDTPTSEDVFNDAMRNFM